MQTDMVVCMLDYVLLSGSFWGINRQICDLICFFFLLLQEVQILKALVLGEEERGQSQYQVMCFVCHFNKDDFISSDAMSKLRQVSLCFMLRIARFCIGNITKAMSVNS